MENTTQLFLAVRFNCNKCHDHPFERWTQDQYYQTAAFFARVGLKADPASGERKIGGTAVEAAKPLYEIVDDTSKGEVNHDRTEKVDPAEVPLPRRRSKPAAGATAPDELAAWLTSKDNPYFARSYVNRLWGYLFGVGIIEPIDDIRAGNPPTNPELLDYLTAGVHQERLRRPPRDAADLQVADVPALGRDEQVERGRQDQLLARDRPPAAGRGAARRGLPGDRLGLEVPGRGAGDPGGGAARLGRRAAQRLPDHLRPPGPRERLRVRAVQRPAARPGHGPGQRPDDRRRHRRPGQRADQAGRRRGGRHQADRRAVPADPQPARDPRGDRDLPQGHAGRRRGPPPAGRGARPREAEFAIKRPELERRAQAAIAAAKAALAAYEKELAPRLAEQERKKAEATAKLEADLKAYEATMLAKKLADWEKDKAASVVTAGSPLEPKTTGATNRSVLTKEPDGSIIGLGTQHERGRHDRRRDRPDRDHRHPPRGPRRHRLPNKGPGRAPDGNFVLNEFE